MTSKTVVIAAVHYPDAAHERPELAELAGPARHTTHTLAYVVDDDGDRVTCTCAERTFLRRSHNAPTIRFCAELELVLTLFVDGVDGRDWVVDSAKSLAIKHSATVRIVDNRTQFVSYQVHITMAAIVLDNLESVDTALRSEPGTVGIQVSPHHCLNVLRNIVIPLIESAA